MRGIDVHGEAAFAYVSCEARVPVDHPLRIIRATVDDALEALSAEFNESIKMCGELRLRRLASGGHLRPWPGTIF